MLNNHYIKIKTSSSEILSLLQNLVLSVIQRDSVMDMFAIYGEVRIYCNSNNLDIPELKYVIEIVKDLVDKEIIFEIDGEKLAQLVPGYEIHKSSMYAIYSNHFG